MLFVFRFTLTQQPVCFALPPKGASNPKMCRCSVLYPGSGTFHWSVSALVHMPTVAHTDIFQFFRLHYNAVQFFIAVHRIFGLDAGFIFLVGKVDPAGIDPRVDTALDIGQQVVPHHQHTAAVGQPQVPDGIVQQLGRRLCRTHHP